MRYVFSGVLAFAIAFAFRESYYMMILGLVFSFIIAKLIVDFGTNVFPRLMVLVMAIASGYDGYSFAIAGGNPPYAPAVLFFFVGGIAYYLWMVFAIGYNPFHKIIDGPTPPDQAELDFLEERKNDPSRDKLGQLTMEDVDSEDLSQDLMYLVALGVMSPDLFRRCAAHVPKLGSWLVTADTDNLIKVGTEYDLGEANAAVSSVADCGLLTLNEEDALYQAVDDYKVKGPTPKATVADEQVNKNGQTFDPERDIHDGYLFRLAGTRMISIDVFLRAMMIFNPAYESWRARIENFPEEQIHKGDANDAAELLRVGLITTPEFMQAMKVYEEKMAVPQQQNIKLH